MMTPAMREDLAGREQDIQRGKTVELLRRAGKEMYDNPIVNTAIGFTPVLGDVQAAGETMAALNRGAPWQETAGYAAGMLPFVPMIGKTVWHGSPHSFDKFDMSKIGTGEGAQAYGHGLYLAEAQDVAKGYKEALSNPEVVLRSGERISNPAVGTNEDVAKAWLEEQFLKGSETPFDDAIARLNKLKGAANNPKQFEGAADVLNQWKNEGATVDLGGSLYKVDLPDEQIAKMLDWDKPLSEQPQAVQDALHQAALVNFETNIGPKASGEIGDLGWTKNVKSMSGEDLYRKLTEGSFTDEMFLQGAKKGEAQAVISEKLRQAGIPGIQYLDQASRGAGDGTRNYVVFSDEIPQILERNGTPLGNAVREYKQLESLNPTGTVMTEYNPLERATLPLGKNMATLDVTSGMSPDEMVEIYRGVPQGVSQISPGDFITTNRQLAQDYAGGGNVISQKVPYRTILDDLTEPLGEEYIYRP